MHFEISLTLQAPSHRAPAASSFRELAGATLMADVDTMSLKDLKQLIAKAGLTLDGCIEKPDLRQRAREAQAALAAGAAEATTHTGPEEDHIDAEIADATEGLAVSTEKKQGRGGGDGDAGGADAEGAEGK
eukprot:scaffold129010_cov69-Phaeocystis_antarctica.AAC.5